MTWREFQLKRMGFERSEKRKWFMVREIGYASLIGGHIDPKKLPKDKYIPLDDNTPKKASSSAFEALKREREIYSEKVKEKLNGSGT